MAELPKLVLEGSPHDRGYAHGEAFADEIAANVDRYLDYFSSYGVDEDTAREQAADLAPLIAEKNERYYEEMEGVAAGSDLPLEDVTIVNVRHTIVYSAFSEDISGTPEAEPAPTDGCTSFGVLPGRSASGHTLVGQNWDWLKSIDAFLMDARPEEGPNFLTLTEAGMVGGKFGMNEHGIGYVVNGLTTPDDGADLSRKPSHVRGREILTADRMDRAIEPIISEKRPCSRNYMVGHRAGEIVNIETGPDAVSYRYPDDSSTPGVLTHANHFEDRDTFTSEFEQMVPSTLCRGMRMRRLFSQLDTVAESDLKEILRDHFDKPTSVCSHELIDDDYPSITKASIIMDLEEGRMLAARGPPCEHEYVAHDVAT